MLFYAMFNFHLTNKMYFWEFILCEKKTEEDIKNLNEKGFQIDDGMFIYIYIYLYVVDGCVKCM